MPQRKNNLPDYERASGSGLHEGHRERMRNKFKIHGDRVFETHELMEMLLYHIIPYRDTNPTAWRLMKRFSNLDGLAAATQEDISSVDGVGEKTADFIARIFKIFSKLEGDELLFKGENVLTMDDVGKFFVDYFEAAKERDGEDKYRIVAIMLDSEMRVLSITEPYDVDAGSAFVRSRPFIDSAVAVHANAVILAHNHPYSTEWATESDKATQRLVTAQLNLLGITIVDHFIISGHNYTTLSGNTVLKISQRKNWIKEKDGVMCLPSDEIDPVMHSKTELVFSLLSLIMKQDRAREMSEVLSRRFSRLIEMFTAELYVLKTLTGSETSSLFIKLFFSIYKRRNLDRFVFGRAHSEKDIAKYFMSLIGCEPLEKVYAMLFDSRGRAMRCEFVSEGTVDTSNIPPRRLLEIAKRNEAVGVAVAHNHPSSGVEPSENDMSATAIMMDVLESSGVKFYSHYIVSHNDFCIFGKAPIKYKKDLEI